MMWCTFQVDPKFDPSL